MGAAVVSTIVAKFADHLPLYRQAQNYTLQDVDLDRSALAAWVGKAAYELVPASEALMADHGRELTHPSWCSLMRQGDPASMQ